MQCDDFWGNIAILVVMVLTFVFFLWMIQERMIMRENPGMGVVSNDISAMYVSPRISGIKTMGEGK